MTGPTKSDGVVGKESNTLNLGKSSNEPNALGQPGNPPSPGSLPLDGPGEASTATEVKVDRKGEVKVDPRHYTHSRQLITEEKLAAMSKPEIRAVANDRGYKIGEGGRSGLVRNFLEEQGKEEGLHEPGKLEVPEVEKAPEPNVAPEVKAAQEAAGTEKHEASEG